MGLLRHVLCQRQQMRQHGGVVLQLRADLADFLRRHVALLSDADDHAFLDHSGEGYLHPLAQGERHALRDAVGKGVRHVLMHNVHNDLCVHGTTPST